MQYLIFCIGADSYGLPAACVRKVLPLLELKQLPGAPGFVAGLMNLHGESVPVVDLRMLTCGTPCAEQFDTRIIVTDYTADDGRRHLLGMIAERVTSTLKLDPEQFREPGVSLSATSYLGKVAAQDGRLLQLVLPDQLLPQAAQRLLYPNSQDHAA